MKQPEINCSYDELRAAITLQPHPRNPNTHSDEQIKLLAKIIQHQGWRNPVVVSKLSGFIVAGHGRLKAAELLGLDEVPVDLQDFKTEADELAHLVADNRIAELSEINRVTLADIIADLDTGEIDLELTGFELPDLEELMTAEHPGEGLTDDNEVPDPPEQPVTVEGDVWVLGRHRIMCGDSTSIDAVEKLMDGKKADSVITDPPYNQETDGGFRGNIGKSLKKQSSEIEHMCDFDPTTMLPILPLVHNKGKMNATIFCNKDLVPDYLSWAREAGYSFNILVWKKPNAIPLGGSYMPDIEYCLVFRRSGKFNTKVEGVSYSKVLVHSRETGLHPTMKPVDMLENQIKIVSDRGDVILDLFGGSGSTLIACEKTSRHCRMMELDPKYCDVIIKRWQEFTGKKATHAETGKKFETH